MYTLTVTDADDSGWALISFPRILEVLGDSVAKSLWTARSVEATGIGGSELECAADEHRVLTHGELVALVGQLNQIIDGEFFAYEVLGLPPWLIIRAVDGSSWDISTNREDILGRVRLAFRAVRETGEVGYGES